VDLAYVLENQKWVNANKKCMAFIKNMIENVIASSIKECTSVGEFLEKIKSQFTGSSKVYAIQLLKQLVTEKYTGRAHSIREHILRMSNMASKLKPVDADLELKPALLVHLVMASLPKEFDNIVINYNMYPNKWDIEKMISMCVQEEDRMKASNGGSINYVKDNRKRNYQNSNQGSPSKPYGKGPQQYHQPTLPVDKH
jgi:ionotropic glutamate receptor